MQGRSYTDVKKVRSAVKAALDAADPEGLLEIGCPDDEYDSEASAITARVLKLHSRTLPAVEAIVLEVWREYFGPFGGWENDHVQRLRPLAASIFDALLLLDAPRG